MHRVIVRGILVVALAFGLVGTVHAHLPVTSGDTVLTTFQNVSPGGQVDLSVYGSSTFSTSAGIFNWTRTGGTSTSTAFLGSFQTVCLEIRETIKLGTTYYEHDLDEAPVDDGNQAPPMGVIKADRIRQLFAHDWEGHLPNSSVSAAAFQVSVWELRYDSDFDLDTGDFKNISPVSGFKKDVYDAANVLLNWVKNNPNARKANLIALLNDGAQDQVGLVPEPSALLVWTMIGGLFGMGVFVRRRRVCS